MPKLHLGLLAITVGLALALPLGCTRDGALGDASDGGAAGEANAGGASAANGGGMSDDGLAGSGSGGHRNDSQPSENEWFRVNRSSVYFDSTNDQEVEEIEVEALQGTLKLYADTVAPDVLGEPQITVDRVTVESTGPTTAVVRIYRESPGRFAPGTYLGQVEVRGCIDDECKELYVDVEYLVVRLLLVTTSNYTNEAVRFRRFAGTSGNTTFELPLRMSDGRPFSWNAEVTDNASGPPTWFTVNTSGTEQDPMVFSLTDRGLEIETFVSSSIKLLAGRDQISFTFRYEVIEPLEVSPSELRFSARVGEVPEPQTVLISDPDGRVYNWWLRVGGFVGQGCVSLGEPGAEFIEGGLGILPTRMQVSLPAAESPATCRAVLEVVRGQFLDIIYQKVLITYEVEE